MITSINGLDESPLDLPHSDLDQRPGMIPSMVEFHRKLSQLDPLVSQGCLT